MTALVDTSGAVVERYLYDPYGKVTVCDGSWTPREGNASAYSNEILFTGHRLDPESGLYITLHRHYHPTLGRWMQRDPKGYVDGMSLYEYVRSCPNSKLDTYGLDVVFVDSSKAKDEVYVRKGTSEFANDKDKAEGRAVLVTEAARQKNLAKAKNEVLDKAISALKENRDEAFTGRVSGDTIKRDAKIRDVNAKIEELERQKVRVVIGPEGKQAAADSLRKSVRPSEGGVVETHSGGTHVLLGGEVMTPDEFGALLGDLKGLWVRDLTLGSCRWDKNGVQAVSNRVNVPVGGSPGDEHQLGHAKYGVDEQGAVVDVKTPFQAAKFKTSPEPLMVPLVPESGRPRLRVRPKTVMLSGRVGNR